MHVSTTIQGTNEAIDRVGQDLGKLVLNVNVQVDQARRERLLQSLKYPGFNERRNEVRKAHTDTYQWVFAGDGNESAEPDSQMSTTKWDSFSNWLKSTDTFYWISGKPGSGKSTLIKYVLADPQTQQCLEIWSPGCLLISHYLWRPGSPMQRSIKGLFCSLLFQLLENSGKALEGVLELAAGSDMKSEVTDWSLEELQSTVLSTMEAYERAICMFLDGLDELYPDQPATLLEMIKKLSVAGKTKICLASRPEPPLQRRLYNMPQLRLQDLTSSDLTRYAYDNLHASNFENLDRYEKFAKKLVKRAEGVFLWLVLVTKSVRNGFENGDSIGIINERVDRLKGGDLESLYKDMWDRASKDNPDTCRRTAALYFRIMLFYNRWTNYYQRIYKVNLGVFTMMLATTEAAEKILHTALQPVNLVPEEMLLQSCKEVERIANIYCFGLLEISHQTNDDSIKQMVGWYRGKYDKLLVYMQAQRALVFIHRTAADFLVDTAQGQEILSYDNTSESSHAIRLVTADLAQAQLFCALFPDTGSLASSHLRRIDWVRWAYTDADGSVTADCTRMMMFCKNLCDYKKLFVPKDVDFPVEVYVCSDVDFFRAVAMHSWRCLDIIRDQIKTLDKTTLSRILCVLCDLFGINPCWSLVAYAHEEVLRFINLLLLEGADPNWHGTTAFSGSATVSRPYTCRWTPFVALLSQTLTQAQKTLELGLLHCSGEKPLWNDPTNLLVTLQTFIRCGADLEEKLLIFFDGPSVQPSTAESPETFQCLEYSPLHPGDTGPYRRILGQWPNNRYRYVCSFPAHHILNLVLSEWEPLRQVCNEERLFGDVTSSVAYYSLCRPRRMNQIVLRRLETIGYDRWKWCMAPREHQDQIGKELMSLMNLSGRSIDTFQRTPSAATQALGYQTLTTMLCGSHWVETGQGSLRSAFEHLAEFGLFAEYSIPRNFHSIKEWLKLRGMLGQ